MTYNYKINFPSIVHSINLPLENKWKINRMDNNWKAYFMIPLLIIYKIFKVTNSDNY